MKMHVTFTLFACLLALFNLTSCDKKEEPSLIGHWDSDAKESEDYDQYDTFIFDNERQGRHQKWTKTPNSPVGNATSDYEVVFEYTYQDNTLTIDYGFNFIHVYQVSSFENDLLIMRLGSHEEWYNRIPFYDGDAPNYAMDIIASWDIDDTEKSRRYQVTCRADGTYESLSSEYDNAPLPETGTYKVDKSRVKFESADANSLLNGRIFMISWCTPCEPDWPHGWIHLISENGIKIIGKQIL